MFDLLSLLRFGSDRKELAEAREITQDAEVKVKALTKELRAIDRENHIAAKVHAAFRGE